jgi:tRNA 2-thiouridine synthesizing protein C
MMGASIVVEEEALRERGIKLKDWGVEIKKLPKDDICALIKDSEVTLTW